MLILVMSFFDCLYNFLSPVVEVSMFLYSLIHVECRTFVLK